MATHPPLIIFPKPNTHNLITQLPNYPKFAYFSKIY